MIQPAITLIRLAVMTVLFVSCPSMGQEIEEVVITVDFRPDEKLQTAEVSDILSAEDITVAGDSNVGDALKRLPGLSLVGGKFIYVRGLGERYSSTYFNGTPIPSPIPLQRSVPLDIFGTSIVESLLVQKTYSPNYGAEFSGGVVDIRSSALPDEAFFKIKLSTGHNSISTHEAGLAYAGGGNDFWGVDDGTRDIPSAVRAGLDSYPNVFSPTASSLDANGQDAARLGFNNHFSVHEKENPLDLGISIAAGNRWELSSDSSIGATLRASIDNKYRNSSIQRSRYAADLITSPNTLSDGQLDKAHSQALTTGDLGELGYSRLGNVERTTNKIRTNALASVGWEWRESNTFKFTSLLTRMTTDETSIDTRRRGNSEEQLWQDHRLQWAENEIIFNQLSGEHFFDAVELNWRYAKVDASRDVPDGRTYRLIENTEDLQNAIDNALANGIPVRRIEGGQLTTVNVPVTIDDLPPVQSYLPIRGAGLPTREYTSLDGETEDYGFDVVFHLFPSGVESFDIKLGYTHSEETREYQSYRFTYDLNGLVLKQDDQLGQCFGAICLPDVLSQNSVPYISDDFHPYLFLPIDELLDSSTCEIGGVPTEDDSCYLATSLAGRSSQAKDLAAGAISFNEGFTNGSPDTYQGSLNIEAAYIAFDVEFNEFFRANVGWRSEKSEQEISLNLNSKKVDVVLPALSFTWSFYDNMQLRGAYSESINRPLLRELAAVQSYNADDGREYKGNSALETADIRSLDLRYEWYFGDGDYLSVSGFRKKITNAIELTESLVGDADALFSWTNVPLAENEGYEFEIRKYLSDQWFVTANATHINSGVTLNEEFIAKGQRPGRPLTGLSKELYNAQVVYESEYVTASLAYNHFSRRLFANLLGGVEFQDAAVAGAGEIYEDPFDSLDFALQTRIYADEDVFVVSMKVNNILGESKIIRYQNGLLYDKQDVGTSASLSVKWEMY